LKSGSFARAAQSAAAGGLIVICWAAATATTVADARMAAANADVTILSGFMGGK